MKDYYFKGIHYEVKQPILSADPIVKLYEKDFKLLKNYIIELEGKLHRATGEHSKSIKEKGR